MGHYYKIFSLRFDSLGNGYDRSVGNWVTSQLYGYDCYDVPQKYIEKIDSYKKNFTLLFKKYSNNNTKILLAIEKMNTVFDDLKFAYKLPYCCDISYYINIISLLTNIIVNNIYIININSEEEANSFTQDCLKTLNETISYRVYNPVLKKQTAFLKDFKINDDMIIIAKEVEDDDYKYFLNPWS